MAKKYTRMTTRIENPLMERAGKQADKQRRSFNAWLNIAVEEKLERDEKKRQQEAA
ncbi:MAG: hypothetical protein ACPGF7_05960 [Pontibacterium sp.]